MGAPRQLLTLDVGRRNASRHVVYLGEGDVNGTTLIVTVTEGGTPFDCDEYVPYLMVPVRDGTVYRQEGTASGNTVTITVDESGLGNVSGKLPGAYVSLEAEDGTVTSTQRFDVCVIESWRESVAPDTFATDMEALEKRVAALEAALGIAADDGTGQTDDGTADGDGQNDDGNNAGDAGDGDGSQDSDPADVSVVNPVADTDDDPTGGE